MRKRITGQRKRRGGKRKKICKKYKIRRRRKRI